MLVVLISISDLHIEGFALLLARKKGGKVPHRSKGAAKNRAGSLVGNFFSQSIREN